MTLFNGLPIEFSFVLVMYIVEGVGCSREYSTDLFKAIVLEHVPDSLKVPLRQKQNGSDFLDAFTVPSRSDLFHAAC